MLAFYVSQKSSRPMLCIPVGDNATEKPALIVPKGLMEDACEFFEVVSKAHKAIQDRGLTQT